jgi:hypothetical protein
MLEQIQKRFVDFVMDYPRWLTAAFILFSMSELIHESASYSERCIYFFASVGIYKLVWFFIECFDSKRDEKHAQNTNL